MEGKMICCIPTPPKEVVGAVLKPGPAALVSFVGGEILAKLDTTLYNQSIIFC